MKTLVNVIIWIAAFIAFSWFFDSNYPEQTITTTVLHFVGFGMIMATIFYPYNLLIMMKNALVVGFAFAFSKIAFVLFILAIGVHLHHNVIKNEKA